MKTITKVDIAWNYIGTIFNMCIGFLLLPFLLKFLSTDELGLWYVMNSYSAISNLFTFGFTPAFSRNIAYCWNGAKELTMSGKAYESVSNEIDYDLFGKILGVSKKLYFFIAIIATFFIAVIGTFHINYISYQITSFYNDLAWFIFVIAIFLNLYYGFYSSYLIGIGKVKESNQILVISGGIRIATMMLFMWAGLKLVAAALAFLAYGLAMRILSKKCFFNIEKIKKNIETIKNKDIEKDTFKFYLKIVWYNAWKDGVVSISDYLSTQASTLVCSTFLSLSETAIFSLTMQLVGMIGKVAKSIHNAYTPIFQGAYIKGDFKKLKENQSFCIFAFSIVYWLGILGLCTIGIPLIRFIKEEVYIRVSIIIGYAIYQYILSFRNCYGSYLSCTNRVIYWKGYIITSVSAITTYTLALIFFDCGIWGIIIISIISELVYNFRVWPNMVNRELNIHIKDICIIGLNKSIELIRGERNE